MSDKRELRILEGGGEPNYGSREEWLAAGARFVETRSAVSWAYADWLKAGLDAWGEAALREAEAASGNSPKKISNYVVTATAYPPSRRRDGLTFSHHLEVARLGRSLADGLLARAEAEGWTQRKTREVAREATLPCENERLRRELALTKRQLREARLNARDFVERARAQLAASRRLLRGEGRRTAALAEAMAETEALESLHGNARLGLARDILRAANNLAADTNAVTERMARAAGAIKGGA